MSSPCNGVCAVARQPVVAALCVVAALQAALQADPVFAAGYLEIDRGASTLARGGANIAAPTDATAVYMNPAALVGVTGLQLLVDANIAVDNRRFDRRDGTVDGTNVAFSAVENQWSAGPSPGAFASYNLGDHLGGIGKAAIGAGLYGPTRVYRTWPEEGPQRYSEVRYAPLLLNTALTAAYEAPWLGLRVGVTGLAIRQSVNTALNFNMLTLGGREPEDTRYDARIDVQATDPWIPSVVVAVSMAPTDWLVVSATHQPGYGVNASGDVGMTPGEGLEGLDVQGDAVDVTMRMPAITRAAVMLRDPHRRYDVEVAAVREGWAGTGPIVFTSNVDIQGERVAPLTFDPHWRDTWSVRIGGAAVVWPERLTLRAGSYYERAAVAADHLNVGLFDLNKLGFTAGGRIEMPLGLWCDVAVAYARWLKRDVDNSQVTLVDPLDPTAATWAVANGEYTNSQLLVMAALGVEFDL